jgi:hypothetical protein
VVKYVADRTGRFSQRPHYLPRELDRECECAIVDFLTTVNGEAVFPVSTDDLTRLIERDTDDLDLYADLSLYGPKVEGLTEFRPGQRPSVRISGELADDERRENRLRTTLTHEWGHVHFHAYLWELEPPTQDLLAHNPNASRQICKRDTMINAQQADWMEWQAGYVCGALLMPLNRLQRLVGSYQESEGLYGCVDAASPHAKHLIAELQKAFGVSADAARVRLLKLGIVGRDAGPSLFSLRAAE